jgi:anti-sigma-K factor RskA
MNHEQAYELIEAFAFGTLDAPEHEAVEHHLATGCAECDSRLREMTELSLVMAESVPAQTPPAYLKAKVMDRISSTPERSAVALPDLSGVKSWLRVAWGTAVVSAATAIFFFMQSGDLRREVENLNKVLNVTATQSNELQTKIAEYEKAFMIDAPGYRFVSLGGVDPNPQAHGHIVMRPDGKSGLVYLYKFPEQPEGKSYQLWGMMGEEPMSIGMFNVAADGSAILNIETIPRPDCIVSFKVTIEPGNGVPAPTGMLYATGDNWFRDHH